jgi:DNA-binding ferritin-like protein (oxidative damage protectant)
MKKSVIASLKNILANTYLLYLKTQNYHWNVSGGPFFKTLHELFETNYKELAEAVDLIAERIRQLGDKAPASFSEFNTYAVIKEGQSSKKYSQMLSELADDQKTMLKILQEAVEFVESHHDGATVDLINARLAAHSKAAWFYSSSLE